MADEPSAGELSRRIDYMTAMLRGEQAAEGRLTERRITELENDVGELRRSVAEEIRALRESLQTQADRRGTNMRQAVYAGLLPAVLVLLGIAVQVWIALRGA